MEKSKVVKWCGSQYALAKALNLRPSTVTRWKRWVPAKYHDKIKALPGFPVSL